MFAKSSRYEGVKHIEAFDSNGRKVRAVFLRRILLIEGELTNVKGNDRLDIISADKYGDPTLFWHIADANTELQAKDLIPKTGKIRPFVVPPS